MNFSQNELLLFYLFVVICVVASFIAIRKKPRDPVKLKLGRSGHSKPVAREKTAPQNQSQGAHRAHTQSGDKKNYDQPRKEKALNAFFEFRGQKYDAYEVLGIPAGASIIAAQSAFNAQFLSAQGDHRALLKAALEAIRHR